MFDSIIPLVLVGFGILLAAILAAGWRLVRADKASISQPVEPTEGISGHNGGGVKSDLSWAGYRTGLDKYFGRPEERLEYIQRCEGLYVTWGGYLAGVRVFPDRVFVALRSVDTLVSDLAHGSFDVKLKDSITSLNDGTLVKVSGVLDLSIPDNPCLRADTIEMVEGN